MLVWRRLRYGYAFRRIPLTRGKFAIVDADDYDRLAQYKWHASKPNHTFYAARTSWCKIQKKNILLMMHRVIMNAPDGLFVDHINRDGLDNRKVNLRLATQAENRRNCRRPKGKHRSQYKGVSRKKDRRRWFAAISVNNRTIWLGCFDSEIEAARAYDAAARKYHKEFAALNFPD